MKKSKLVYLLLSASCVFALSSCTDKSNSNPSYDGREFDISINQDKSLIAKSTKDGFSYNLEITGSGTAIDYSKKEEAPWYPLSKKINKVTINEGIENIGDYFFTSLTLDYYLLPSTVLSVGDHSFNSDAIIYTYGGLLNNIDNEVYYYSETKPTGPGNYFHIEDGEPTIWVYVPGKVSFLFIGNSFTYRGVNTSETNPAEVPADFEKIAKNLGIEVEVDAVYKGSHSLTKFADKTDEYGAVVEQKLTTNKYDYVILQEQSTTPINNYSTFLAAVKKLKARIDATQTNCKTVLYETWGTPYNVGQDPQTYGATVGAMEAKLRTAYQNAGEESGCSVNYVGKAFTYTYENYSSIGIYADDNRHQNGYGAYLSAACHVRSIFKMKVSNCTEYRSDLSLDQNSCKTLLGVADTIC